MLALIYAIMAVVVFAAVNIFFWKISFDLDKEMREEMRECGDYHIDTDEARFGKTVGDRKFVPSMALAAKAFGANGYFCEVHPDPDKGLSDAANMLELANLESLIVQLQ